MARQDALQGSLPLLVLTLLARRGPLHGYAIATQIEQMSDELLRVEEGSLYPALHRLEEARLIKAKWTTTDTGRRARVYEITADGRKQLSADEQRWKAITAAVGKILRHA
ncbi:MAG TPA: PadR family transcriptional regulator [Vicinamibacterales bacterium]|nr:PadR family transcriptional regulator [Vicinamibacterales bacterium]